MSKKKSRLDKFSRLTWNDIDGWTSGNIISRGRTYQRQGRVFDLVVTTDGGLIAWVEGSERYATKVVMNTDGQLDSICTCPYRFDCKHGVAGNKLLTRGNFSCHFWKLLSQFINQLNKLDFTLALEKVSKILL